MLWDLAPAASSSCFRECSLKYLFSPLYPSGFLLSWDICMCLVLLPKPFFPSQSAKWLQFPASPSFPAEPSLAPWTQGQAAPSCSLVSPCSSLSHRSRHSCKTTPIGIIFNGHLLPPLGCKFPEDSDCITNPLLNNKSSPNIVASKMVVTAVSQESRCSLRDASSPRRKVLAGDAASCEGSTGEGPFSRPLLWVFTGFIPRRLLDWGTQFFSDCCLETLSVPAKWAFP